MCEKYSGTVDVRLGPTLAAEHLASEDGIRVHHDTLRRWMLAAGLWSRARKRAPHRQRRARKAHFGEMVQLDGISNDWVVRYHTRCFQVARQSHRAPARSTVLVREAVTGAIEIRYRGRLMRWSGIPAPPPKPTVAPGATRPATAPGGRPLCRPSADHTWRRGYVERQQCALELGRGQ